MGMRRDCGEVISQMILEIPESEAAFLKDLRWNMEDAAYKAPEETLQWERTMQTLQKYIPKPEDEWHFKVLSIFTTHDIATLREWVAARG